MPYDYQFDHRRSAFGRARGNVHSKRHHYCLSMTAHAGHGARSSESVALEEVIVTGFRASLAEVDQKRIHADDESVTAGDIGKFPDQNVAEFCSVCLAYNPAVGDQGVGADRWPAQVSLLTVKVLTGKSDVSNEALGGAGSNSQTSPLESIPVNRSVALTLSKSQ
jgi:hypothetical protein